jgi:hypothetical protein
MAHQDSEKKSSTAAPIVVIPDPGDHEEPLTPEQMALVGSVLRNTYDPDDGGSRYHVAERGSKAWADALLARGIKPFGEDEWEPSLWTFDVHLGTMDGCETIASVGSALDADGPDEQTARAICWAGHVILAQQREIESLRADLAIVEVAEDLALSDEDVRADLESMGFDSQRIAIEGAAMVSSALARGDS